MQKFFSILYTAYGPRMAWNMEIIIISTTLFLWCFFYRRMITLRAVLQLEAVKIENGKSENGIVKVKSNSRIHPTIGDEEKSTSTAATA